MLAVLLLAGVVAAPLSSAALFLPTSPSSSGPTQTISSGPARYAARDIAARDRWLHLRAARGACLLTVAAVPTRVRSPGRVVSSQLVEEQSPARARPAELGP